MRNKEYFFRIGWYGRIGWTWNASSKGHGKSRRRGRKAREFARLNQSFVITPSANTFKVPGATIILFVSLNHDKILLSENFLSLIYDIRDEFIDFKFIPIRPTVFSRVLNEKWARAVVVRRCDSHWISVLLLLFLEILILTPVIPVELDFILFFDNWRFKKILSILISTWSDGY